ncbi:hypothetical protein FB567DRAFT_613209 [Paraphoma chrysanthemicola]|uniref:Uncharacterized protein n=1 Tax=Paraphoma chrysanthemicola TaxID=798071 RepID=A0A8K0VS68_9PLEO|nr:hypothetical protein FB567DRAFT_613209 [Paraphoma chrysanthemicola]
MEDSRAAESAAGCRKLCTDIHAALPPEVRHRIYGFVLDDLDRVWSLSDSDLKCECPSSAPNLDDGDTDEREKTLRSIRAQCGINKDPFTLEFYNPQYFGMDTFNELVAMWYRNTVMTLVDCQVIPPLLITDPWGLGVPLKYEVQSIRTYISTADMGMREKFRFDPPVPCERYKHIGCCTMDAITASLRGLKDIRHSVALLVHVELPKQLIVYEDYEDSATYSAALGVLFATLKELEKHGHRVLLCPSFCIYIKPTALQILKSSRMLPTVSEWLQLATKLYYIDENVRPNLSSLSITDRMWLQISGI